MEPFHAFILALVQGITEFLPISSSAHLILVPEFLGWPDQGLAFDVAVHVGSLVAVVVFLRKELGVIIPAWLSGWKKLSWNASGELGWFVVLATIPVGLVGLLGESWIENNLRSPIVIAIGSALFGALLWLSDRGAKANSKSLSDLSWGTALLVGFAQAFALIPGASRSGVTMTALLALGYDRVTTAKFSFLLAIPTITLPGLLKANELVQAEQGIDWLPLGIGIIGSAVFALVCMKWFISVIERVGMLPFVLYRFALAAVLLWVFL